MASGKYVAFIDDDDEISPRYLPEVLMAIKESEPDVIGMIGILRWQRTRWRLTDHRFYHSIQYDRWFESKDIKNREYFRPPNHLNPMRRDIATQFRFKEVNFGEDRDWSERIQKSGLLTKEVMIGVPIYYYNYNPFKK
jgi:glycosyltransferase involved in cell wall biosynthesis